MNPFYFGTPARRLFGVYTPRAPVGAPGRAVVVCHPWGQEYLRAYRSLRHLAMLLSRAGVDVLRFDYHGTGDSAGEATDGDAAAWAGDVSTAIEELKDTAGADRVGLVGLRLGATLAATAAAERDDVDAVALWDPVVDGSCYVRELVALAGEARAGEGTEVLGFPLTPAMVRSIEELRLVPVLPSLPQRSLVVVTDARAEHAPLAAAVGTRVLERVPAAPPWTEEGNSGVGAMPVEVLQRLARWWS